MSWTEELYSIYELNSKREFEDNEPIMLPVAHSTANAQIEITIDADGNYVNAQQVEKENAVTIIPATENSATRSSGICAMPFADKLVYIAGDYARYAKGKNADNSKHFEAYITQLEEWKNSEYSYPAVKALYSYIKEKRIMSDLVKAGILITDETDGLLKDDVKISGIAQEDSFVRFIINYPDKTSETWEDKSLYESFIAFNASMMNDVQLCYATGEYVPITYKHPSKIRNSGDKAKLFSANDESGFTYRGRFANKEQAVSIGYEYSQKVHNALRWLIQKQGMSLDTLTVVAWASGLQKFMDYKEKFINDDAEDDFEPPSTMERFSGMLKKSIFGYMKNINNRVKLMIMGIDAATTGRLNVSFYSELHASEFYKNIEKWHLQTAMNRYSKKLEKYIINSFGIVEIVKNAFGTEQGAYIDCDKRVLRDNVVRLIPCVTEGRPIPRDIVIALYNKASNPLAYEKNYNFSNVLETACGMIRKSLIEKNKTTKEDYLMAYDPNETNRSYLFGCLLAIADKAERDTYEKEEKRTTNAKRYWSAFSSHPYQTWMIIEERLRPYLDKLSDNGQVYYEKKIQEITDKMSATDFADNSKLEPLYLLGYHHFTSYLYSKNNNEEA